MTIKLCNRCNRTLPLSEFGDRQKKGKVLKHTQCKKCRNEIHFQWLRETREKEGRLFARTRRTDPERAARLDRFRSMVKQGLPLTAEPVVVQEETDEYHLLYMRNRIMRDEKIKL